MARSRPRSGKSATATATARNARNLFVREPPAGSQGAGGAGGSGQEEEVVGDVDDDMSSDSGNVSFVVVSLCARQDPHVARISTRVARSADACALRGSWRNNKKLTFSSSSLKLSSSSY